MRTAEDDVPGRVTIQMIATAAGVSVATVSKVLNGRPDVAASTRTHVEEVLQHHQYRRLRRKSARTTDLGLIDLVFHDFGSPWSMEIVRGVERAAGNAGVGVVVSDLGGRRQPGQEWIDRVLARPLRGVILLMSNLNARHHKLLTSRGVPVVVVDTDGETPEGVPMVGSNNWFGGLLATRHLAQLGHRRIAMISGPVDVLCSRARVDGWRTAHDESGIAIPDELVRHGNFTVEAGYQLGRELLTLRQRPTAIFAGSDMQALGVLRAAREAGVAVPQELSVVGYDDLPLAEWVAPALTTVHQPLVQMASTATQIVLDTQNSYDSWPLRLELPTHLVVRESTAAPPPLSGATV